MHTRIELAYLTFALLLTACGDDAAAVDGGALVRDDAGARNDGGTSSDDGGDPADAAGRDAATADAGAAIGEDGGAPFAGRATLVASGRLHTCALTETGAVYCWGYTNHGQLGTGRIAEESSVTPSLVTGLDSGVTSLASGGDHSCAVVGGAAMCWGLNERGQLGNGGTTDSATPVPVTGLDRGVREVVAGFEHSCAITEAGALLCWGFNDLGQLGNDDDVLELSRVPVAVVGLGSDVVSAAAGRRHTCAATSAGAAYCWGSNQYGELGSDALRSPRPLRVLEGTRVATVAAGDNTSCAVGAGGVWCWGKNNSGELGDGGGGPGTSTSVPVRVVGLGASTRIVSASFSFTCALADGAATCWGDDSTDQLGDGAPSAGALTPRGVTGLDRGVEHLSSGGGHACAVVSGGVRCWGSNDGGQLGGAVEVGRTSPVPVDVAGFR
jgi:alpha-tubulin suppressor-like RCC1 family protein